MRLTSFVATALLSVCAHVVPLGRVIAVRAEISKETGEAIVEPGSFQRCGVPFHHCSHIQNTIVADGHTESNAPDLF